MRHTTAAAFLLFAACASTTAPRFLSTRASEVVAMGQRMGGAAGTHFIRVRIHNISTEPVLIHSVRVEASGSDLDSEPGSDVFDQTINPGETVPFDVVVTVTSRSRSPALDQELTSVSVTIGYVVGQQDLVDSGTYSLSREISGS